MTGATDGRLFYRYRKNIVARDEVNQSACLLVMSWAEAERRGVPADRLVFLVASGEVRPRTYVRRPYLHQHRNVSSAAQVDTADLVFTGGNVEAWSRVTRDHA